MPSLTLLRHLRGLATRPETHGAGGRASRRGDSDAPRDYVDRLNRLLTSSEAKTEARRSSKVAK